MTDTLSPEQRSQRMSMIRGKDSSSELMLRRMIHGMGYRYRLHVRSLPGTPDIVFPRFRAVIFMHGCFWHRHPNCRLARMPKSNLEFWRVKLESNKLRDDSNTDLLRAMGWRVLVIWECQMKEKDLANVSNLVQRFLGNGYGGARHEIG